MTDQEKIKCAEITPNIPLQYDFYVVKDDGTWKPILDMVEQLLDEQFLTDEAKWTDIGVTIKLKEMTQEAFNELIED